MNYTYKRWTAGEDVTIERLNRLENAVAGLNTNTMVVTGAYSEGIFTLNTAFIDIMDAYLSGKNVIINLTPVIGSESYGKIVAIGENMFATTRNINFIKNVSGYPEYTTK